MTFSREFHHPIRLKYLPETIWVNSGYYTYYGNHISGLFNMSGMGFVETKKNVVTLFMAESSRGPTSGVPTSGVGGLLLRRLGHTAILNLDEYG